MRGKIVYIILILMIACSLYVGIMKIIDYEKESLLENKKVDEVESSNVSEGNDVREDVVVDKRDYVMGEEVSFGNITYKVNYVQTTKEAVGFSTPINWASSYNFDVNGTLVDGNSYIIVNVAIKNNSEEHMEFYLNTMSLVVVKDLETRIQDHSECLSAKGIEGFGRKDFFRVELEPGKEYVYDLVFIAPDTSIENNDGTLIITRHIISTPSESEDMYRYIDVNFW